MLIKEIMTTRVATVSMDDRLTVIKDIFEQAHFRHLLVVEEEAVEVEMPRAHPSMSGTCPMKRAGRISKIT